MLLTVGLFLLLVNLGFWQLDRGQQKQMLEAQLQSRSTTDPVSMTALLSEAQPSDPNSFYGVNVKGTVNPTDEPIVLLDNQIVNGKVGYIVFQPMRLVGQVGKPELVLVDLGFVEAFSRRELLPSFKTLDQATEFAGRLYNKSNNPLSAQQHYESFDHMGQDVLRVQSLNTDFLNEVLSQSVGPILLQPTTLTPWPQNMVWKPFPMSSAKHFGYAVQWFAMAAVFLGLMVWIGWRAQRRSK